MTASPVGLGWATALAAESASAPATIAVIAGLRPRAVVEPD
jgi:hypothetical protein